MSIQLRQIALVARELKPVIDDLCGVFGIKPCFVDEGVGVFGLENVLMPVGWNFLEVVAPVEENTAGGRYLDRRGGDGGYMVICQGGNLATQQAVRQRALDAGVRIAMESERDRHNICQLHPRDMIASFLEIDWDASNDFTGNWNPAGGTGWEDKVTQEVTQDFTGVELQGVDPLEIAELWSEVTALPVQREGAAFLIELNNATLRFVEATDDRGPGLGGVDLAVNDRGHILAAAKERGCYVSDDQVDVCGVRWYLKDAG